MGTGDGQADLAIRQPRAGYLFVMLVSGRQDAGVCESGQNDPFVEGGDGRGGPAARGTRRLGVLSGMVTGWQDACLWKPRQNRAAVGCNNREGTSPPGRA